MQACIPKDPAALWNAEFLQAEELFKQPSTVDNSLRDNRYMSHVLNPVHIQYVTCFSQYLQVSKLYS